VKIEVECYAGYKADERPLGFRMGGRWLEVSEVLDQWYGPGDTYFKVRAATEESFILRRHAGGEWTLDAYRAV
jgi:hypothetical protein